MSFFWMTSRVNNFQSCYCFLFFLFYFFSLVGLFNASGVFIDWDIAVGVEKIAIEDWSSHLNLEKLAVVDLPGFRRWLFKLARWLYICGDGSSLRKDDYAVPFQNLTFYAILRETALAFDEATRICRRRLELEQRCLSL